MTMMVKKKKVQIITKLQNCQLCCVLQHCVLWQISNLTEHTETDAGLCWIYTIYFVHHTCITNIGQLDIVL